MNTMNGGAAEAPTKGKVGTWDCAARNAEQGVPVFPVDEGCKSRCGSPECADMCRRAKSPLVSGGFKSASVDPATIAGWRGKWPDAMFGVPTGEASGLVVLDLDRKNGKDGLRALRDYLKREGEDWPETLMVETPSGGVHLIFQDAPGSKSRTAVLPGVDTRGNGGYVVFAPSKLGDGRAYRVRKNVKPAKPSAAIARLLTEGLKPKASESKAMKASVTPPRAKTELDSRYAAKALRGEANAVRDAAPGERNHRLNVAAVKVGHYVPHLIDRAEAEAELTAAAIEAGLGEEETAKTIASGLTKGIAEPEWPPASVIPATAAEDFGTPEAVAGLESFAASIGMTVETLKRESLAVAARVTERGFDNAPLAVAQPKTLAELLAGGLAKLPPRCWEVKGLFMRGALTVVGGAGGTGKSSLMNAIALSVAAGQPFMGFDLRNPQGEAVLILNGDDDEAEITRRFGAMVQHYGIPATVLGRVHVLGSNILGGLKACAVENREIRFNESWFAWFSAMVRKTGARFVAVDPLFALASLDENDNGQMGAFAGRLNRLAAELGIVLVLVVHANKAGTAASADKGGDRGANLIAGGRRLIDAARAAFVIDALSDKDGPHVAMDESDPRLKQMLGLWGVKGNYVARGAARAYFRMEAVCLQNARGLDDADTVGVPVPYIVPKVSATDTLLLTILDMIDAGTAEGAYSRTRQGGSNRCILPAIAGVVNWEAEGLSAAPAENVLKGIFNTRVMDKKLAVEADVPVKHPSGQRKAKGLVLTAAGRAERDRLKAEVGAADGREDPFG